MSNTQPMADSRDMYVVHDMFRREFKAIPFLVGSVFDGDAARVAIVADHVEWMVGFLHAHHEGEDLLVWPKLLDRAPAETKPLVHTMEAQHAGLEQALNSLKAKTADWRASCAAPERNALVDAATELLELIAEHLELEERAVLSLIDEYLTEEEWKALGGEGLKKFTIAEIYISFGMILNGASPEQVKIMSDAIPSEPWAVFSVAGPPAYAKYAARVFGLTNSDAEPTDG